MGDEKRTSVKPRESLGRFFRFEFVELPQRRRGADRNGNVLGKDRKLRQSPAVVWIIGLEQFQAVFQKALRWRGSPLVLAHVLLVIASLRALANLSRRSSCSPAATRRSRGRGIDGEVAFGEFPIVGITFISWSE